MASVDLHVTLCFVGAAEDAALAALCERAAQIRACVFELEFSCLQYWRAARVLVLRAASAPAAVSELSRQLALAARASGLVPDEKPLCPHVTLMRGVGVAAGPLGDGVVEWPLARVVMASSEFHLAQSQELAPQGCSLVSETLPRYRSLARWPLSFRGAGA